MKYAIWMLLCGVVVVLGGAALGDKSDPGPDGGSVDAILRLPKMEANGRLGLLEELTKARHNRQEGLIRLLESDVPNEIKCDIAYLLGLDRMEQSVEKLSNVITLEKDQSELDKRLPLYGRYPAVQALIRIGNPAVRRMVANIESSDSEKTRELSALVVRQIEGAEIGKIVLEKAMEKQTDDKKRGRLKAAIEGMK